MAMTAMEVGTTLEVFTGAASSRSALQAEDRQFLVFCSLKNNTAVIGPGVSKLWPVRYVRNHRYSHTGKCLWSAYGEYRRFTKRGGYIFAFYMMEISLI